MWTQAMRYAVIGTGFLGIIACSYTPPKPTSQQPGDYPFRDAKAGIVIGVKPFVSAEQFQDVLSTPVDYLSNNVLPLQILVHNDRSDELLMRIANVRLVWSDGSLRNVLTTSETYEAVSRSVVGGAILMGVIGTAVVSSQNEGKMKDLAALSLRDSNIPPRSATAGFVFFPLKKEDASLKGVTLRMVLQNPTSLTETIADIALEGQLPKNRGQVAPSP